MTYNNLADMFFDAGRRYPDKMAMKYKEAGEWRSLTFAQICTEVEWLTAGLISLGVKRGSKVAILAENSYRWALLDYAILAAGAAVAPIYPTLLGDQVAYILNDCQAELVAVSNALQLQKIQSADLKLPSVGKIILLEPLEVEIEGGIGYEALFAEGKAYLKQHPGVVTDRIASIDGNELATFVYTSGTTGEPKGVMLSHGNLLSNIEATLRHVPIGADDVFLSFLPLSHIFERMTGHFLANYTCATIAYAESLARVPENLLEIKPTLMASVPRLFEKIYSRILAGVEEGPAVNAWIFNWAIAVGKRVIARKEQQRIGPLLKLQHLIAHKLVFSKLHQRVGGNIRFFVSGGAALPLEIGEFFAAAGLPVLEGYGLSETAPVLSANTVKKLRLGTVGIPLDNVEIRIAADGEILARGPNIMMGYHNNREATREVIDEDGWFHTGDIGMIDTEGFLKITDRKKNIIVNSGGKNIAPQKIENKLVTTRYIEQALVIGDRRKYCSAVLVPDFEALEKFAAARGLKWNTHTELVALEAVQNLVKEEVSSVNKGLAGYEQVKRFVLADRPFTIESGELTPSLKVKRRDVETNYSKEIDSLYG